MKFGALLQSYLSSRDRGWVISLLIAVSLVYFPFLGRPFIFDDLNFFTTDMREYFANSMFTLDLRWFPNASLGYTYAIFSDENTHMYNVGNALLHACNVILLFYLLRKLINTALFDPNLNSNIVSWGAWFGALVFAIHPVAVYAVGYVIQRSILMATFFALLMQMTYLRGVITGHKLWLGFSVVAFFMAAFSKEHSVLMPAILVAMTVIFRGKIQASTSNLWLTWLAFFAIAVTVTLASRGVFGNPYEAMAPQIFQQQGIEASTPVLHLLSAMNQMGLFFKYGLFWIVPNTTWMSIDLRVPFISSLTVWQGWLGMLAFMIYGVVSVKLLLRSGKHGLAGLAMLYPWLLFWVEMVGVRVQEPFVLYRSYLWMPGIMLILALLFMKLQKRKILLVLGCIVILVPLSWNRLWIFSDNFRLWNEAAMLLPDDKMVGADRIYYNRAHYAAQANMFDIAIPDYEHVTRLDPFVAIVHNDLGVSYLNTKRFQEAIVQFDSAIVLDPESAFAYFNKGITLKRLKKDDLAMVQMIKSCELGYATACVIVKFAPPKK